MGIHCASDWYFLPNNKLLITVLNKQTDKRTNIKPNTVFQVQLEGSYHFRTDENKKSRRATFSEQIIGSSNILFVLLYLVESFFLSFLLH